jgi:SAM-dependent methyltransferase
MSAAYWEARYASGGSSGDGSEGENAAHKARFLNDFVAYHAIGQVLEYGCGDGRQLALANYPSYVGMDVSATAIAMCAERFAEDTTKSFHPIQQWRLADLVLSLDVIYHLTEEEVFVAHLRDVFASAIHWVILYTTDSDYLDPDFVPADHVRHWPVSAYAQKAFPKWTFYQQLVNPKPELGGCDFLVYRR